MLMVNVAGREREWRIKRIQVTARTHFHLRSHSQSSLSKSLLTLILSFYNALAIYVPQLPTSLPPCSVMLSSSALSELLVHVFRTEHTLQHNRCLIHSRWLCECVFCKLRVNACLFPIVSSEKVKEKLRQKWQEALTRNKFCLARSKKEKACQSNQRKDSEEDGKMRGRESRRDLHKHDHISSSDSLRKPFTSLLTHSPG